ncbi:MFS transporter [Microbacterium hydrocarbonoxydans]|uniref:Predicted arabinose efflux permease, MFS family n=1 Tax=Microbacterium hydrocarbonoxydans TaxID=273678 RepID=A0A1H4ITZ8_9MICO|nr:MFS transporter [Microbacterium hydrocarbonoxydans]SEB37106.1 Predicted arabinose efflux permease, MFS family [Microbacterium hydrocarbonoxydans]
MTTDTGGAQTAQATPGILSSAYVWITIGACALVFLGAFESLAVTTVMPAVSADLDGERLYALAFAGPLATGVIGMVVAGNWADRRGPVAPLYTAVALFVVGLLVAGLAPTMEVLVAGRFAQGLGNGGLMVALYVVVARVYPRSLHPAIFAGFAAAWVVPSLVGPTIAGAVTELWSWHWVFLGVVFLVVPALLMVVPALRGLSREGDASAPWALGRLGWAVLAAVAVLGLDLVGDVPGAGPVLAAGAAVVALVAVRALLPAGTLRARRGLPSVLLVRGLAAGGFFGAQVYIPYLLTERYALSPTIAGLSLTGGALAWSVAATVQGRLGARLSSALAVRIGAALVFAGVALALAAAVFTAPVAVIVVSWVVAGVGMGLLSPRSSALTLEMSAPETQGFNSAAMTVAESFGSALALAITGVLFATVAEAGDPFVAVFALAGAIALAAAVLAPRVVPPAA